MLRDEINRALKGALKETDERRISTLRLVNAAIQNADIEAQVRGRSSLADEELLPVLQKMLKQRQESVEIYEKAGRSELADQERREIEIIKAYLPQEMSDDEIESAIAGTLTQLGASSIKDMGKVMAALKQGYAGRMDFAKASGRVKALLAPGA